MSKPIVILSLLLLIIGCSQEMTPKLAATPIPTLSSTQSPVSSASENAIPTRLPKPMQSSMGEMTVEMPMQTRLPPADAPYPNPLVEQSLPCPLNEFQGQYLGSFVLIQLSDRDEWCEVTLSRAGYTLTYPEGWTVTISGPEVMNLRFTTGIDRITERLFVQKTISDLPLERSDEATYGFEMYEPEPLVMDNEQRIHKEIQIIGDKQVLVLTTIGGDDLPIRRYFVMKDDGYRNRKSLYNFHVKTSTENLDEGEDAALIAIVEEMVASMKYTSR